MEEGRIAIRQFIRFDFPGQPVGFWNGPWELNWSGLDYIPNDLIRVEEPDFTTGLEAVDFQIELPQAPGYGVTEATFVQIEAMPYKGIPVTIYEAYFDPDTGALLHVEAMYSGYLDTVDTVLSGGEAKLVANCITDALDNFRESNVSASHEHQQLVSPGDRFFEYAGTVKHETKTVTFN